MRVLLDFIERSPFNLQMFSWIQKVISQFFATLVDYAWGMPLVLLLVGGGLYLIFLSRFIPLKAFRRAFLIMFGRYHHEGDEKASGQLSHFQALSNALAATVGLGNIGGVAVAISQGGPGAVFWMWVAAFIGMNTKFFECTLAVMFRGRDYRGEVQGGPMYVIEEALPSWMKPLAIGFAIFGLIGCMALFQVNQLSEFMQEQYSVGPWWVGGICALLTGYVLFGGIQRLALFTSSLVPFMCLFYVLVGLVIIAVNVERVPEIFSLIFTEAFSGGALAGGATGFAFLKVMQIGVKRAAFSNEAGVGTAPMAHSNAKTSEPISEGLVAMLGPFFDTLLVCTMTALVILISLPLETLSQYSGVIMTVKAFETSLPMFGAHFLGLAIVLFSFTTMLGMANYNEKCWNYLFRGRWFMGRKTFIFVFCTTLLWGAHSALSDVVNILDSGYALMAWPNMVATLILAPRVLKELNRYLEKYKL